MQRIIEGPLHILQAVFMALVIPILTGLIIWWIIDNETGKFKIQKPKIVISVLVILLILAFIIALISEDPTGIVIWTLCYVYIPTYILLWVFCTMVWKIVETKQLLSQLNK